MRSSGCPFTHTRQISAFCCQCSLAGDCGLLSQDVAVDDLGHADATIVACHVEGFAFDVGRVHALPYEVLLGELGVGCRFGLLGDALDGRWSIDRL